MGVERTAGFQDQIVDALVCFRLYFESFAADAAEGDNGLSVFEMRKSQVPL
jgi:hypothetical protein